MNTVAAFDNEKYIKEQTSEILGRTKQFNDKLYLEFGGKLLYDFHAARVLPGYDPNIKMRLLKELKDRADILLCIYAGDIERRKMRADFGISYDADTLKLIDEPGEMASGQAEHLQATRDGKDRLVMIVGGSHGFVHCSITIRSRSRGLGSWCRSL